MKKQNKTKQEYVIFTISGGIGKNIMATAVITSIKAQYPKHKLIIVTAYPEVFINNPKIYRVFKFGNTPYFMEDYVNDDTIILQMDPYAHNSFIHKKKHLVECWCETFGIPCKTHQPEIYLTQREIGFAREKFARTKPLFVIQTNGGAQQQGLNYSWARDIPINQAQQIVNEMNKTHHIMHIRRPNQLALNNTESVSAPLRELFALIALSDKRLFMDSFGEHCAAAFKLQSTVCWIGTNPKIYSYQTNDDITPSDKKQFIHSIDKYMEDTPWGGEKMYECPYDTNNIFSVSEIINSINKQKNDYEMPLLLISNQINQNQINSNQSNQNQLNIVKQNNLINQDNGKIRLFEWKHPSGKTNFGDELSKIVVKWVSGKEVELVDANQTNKLLAIGSIIQNLKDNDTVWGSGKHPFIDSNLNVKNIEVNLVRGPITRKYFIDKGINCPENYGDPALLIPLIYQPQIIKKKKIGIIPYFDEFDGFDKTIKIKDYEIEFIDVRGDWRKIIDLILSCEKIISSSLHGLIVSDAYNIPNIWLKSTHEGEEKYYDYYLGTGRRIEPVITIKEAMEKNPPQIPIINVTNIIASFPSSIGVNEIVAQKYCPQLIKNNNRLNGNPLQQQTNNQVNSELTDNSFDGFIDNYFDKIYVINLDKRTDRLDEVKKQLKNAGINNYQRISGVFITDEELLKIPKEEYAKFKLENIVDRNKFEKKYIRGALGVRKAQINCIKDAKKNGFKKILILEDDVLIHKNANQMFASIINEIGDKWQMLYLGGDYWSNNVTFQASSYALDKELFDFIINNMEKSGEETDFFYVNHIQKNYNVYRATPMLMIQSKKDSDIPTMERK